MDWNFEYSQNLLIQEVKIIKVLLLTIICNTQEDKKKKKGLKNIHINKTITIINCSNYLNIKLIYYNKLLH